MSVTVRQIDDKNVVIAVGAQFDYALHQAFRNAYAETKNPGTSFRVDLSKARHMDSSALGMILLLKEHADKIGGCVILQKPNEAVTKILNIANFNQFVTIES
ncbi:STAS domain-containing protein [Pontibacter sp. JAM-7]|uniref:STAS domain-containing protein n=1 Tax=Pontibacter sp. JAM-7 TaxID=3366581 RepID=UPI003AF8BECE